MSRNPKSLLLVFTQALMLIYLFLSGPVAPRNIIVGTLEILGIILGLWALWTMRISTFQITPDVAPGSVLVTNGPYSFIRHPMYTAVLLIAFGLLLNEFNILRLVATIILVIDLIIKKRRYKNLRIISGNVLIVRRNTKIIRKKLRDLFHLSTKILVLLLS